MGINVRASANAATKRSSLVDSGSVLALGAYFQNLLQSLHLALAVDEAMPGTPRQSTDGGLMVSSSAAAGNFFFINPKVRHHAKSLLLPNPPRKTKELWHRAAKSQSPKRIRPAFP